MRNQKEREGALTKRSKKLREDASFIMEQTGLLKALEAFGTVQFVGSYALDLMMWEDVDMELLLHEEEKVGDSIDAFKKKAHQVSIALTKICSEMKQIKSVKLGINLHEIHQGLPDGIYVQVKFYLKNTKTTWKFDIWILNSSEIHKDSVELERLKKRIKREDKALILQMKNLLLTKSGRTPFQSGHFLYQAILEENLKDEGQIIKYLQNNGIEVSHVKKT